MRNGALLCLALALACDPNVVDAVRLPPEKPPGDDPMPTAGAPAGGAPAETPLQTSLIHRYSFDGEGDVVVDSKLSTHGRAIGVELTGTGTLTLAGANSGQYVELPSLILYGLEDATFEAWLTWSGSNSSWQRIFDFGSATVPTDEQPTTSGVSYLFLTPLAASDSARKLPAGFRLAYAQKGVTDEDVCNAQTSFPMDKATHVAAVVDHTAAAMSLYMNGALLLKCDLARPLSAIKDLNNWLGRSNYSADAYLSGTYDEFRIYNAALTDAEIADSFAAGPNAPP